MSRRLSLYGMVLLAKQAADGEKQALEWLRAISEHDLSVAVRIHAENRGWFVWYHKQTGRMGKNGKWQAMAPAGEPDLRFARAGVVLFAELKAERGNPTPAQRDALEALGPYGRLWRPRDAAAIIAFLDAD